MMASTPPQAPRGKLARQVFLLRQPPPLVGGKLRTVVLLINLGAFACAASPSSPINLGGGFHLSQLAVGSHGRLQSPEIPSSRLSRGFEGAHLLAGGIAFFIFAYLVK